MFGPSGPTLTAERCERFEADREILARVYPAYGITSGRHRRRARGRSRSRSTSAGDASRPSNPHVLRPPLPEAPPEVSERDARSRRWHPDVGSAYPGRRKLLPLAPARGSARRQHARRLPALPPPPTPVPPGPVRVRGSGRWPGPARPHGRVDAYAAHVLERLGMSDVARFRGLWTLVIGAGRRPDRRCPCGSARPYGRCHQRDVEALRWLTRRSETEKKSRTPSRTVSTTPSHPYGPRMEPFAARALPRTTTSGRPALGLARVRGHRRAGRLVRHGGNRL